MKFYTLNKPAPGKNEDSLLARLIDNDLAMAAVADGLSNNNGAVASQCVISRVGLPLEKRLQKHRTEGVKQFVEDIIIDVNDRYLTASNRKDPSKSEKGGTTLDLVLCDLKKNMLNVEHIGDSTVMVVYENGEIEYVTQKPIDRANHRKKPDDYLGKYPHAGDDMRYSNVRNDLTYLEVPLTKEGVKVAYAVVMSDGITNALLNSEFEDIFRSHDIGEESPETLIDKIAEAIYSPIAKIYDMIGNNGIKSKNWEFVLDNYRTQLTENGIERNRLTTIENFKKVFDELKDQEIGREMIRTLAIKEKVIDDSTLVLIDILDRYTGYPTLLNRRIEDLEATVAEQTRTAKEQIIGFTKLAEETRDENATTISGLESAFDEERRGYEKRITGIEEANATTILGLETSLQEKGEEHTTAIARITELEKRLENETAALSDKLKASEEQLEDLQASYKEGLLAFVGNVYNTIGEKKPIDMDTYDTEALYTLVEGKINDINAQNQKSSGFLGSFFGGGKKKKQLTELLDNLPQFEKELERLRTQEGRYNTLRQQIDSIKEQLDPNNTNDDKVEIRTPNVVGDEDQTNYLYSIGLVQSMITSYSRLNEKVGSLDEQVTTLNDEIDEIKDKWTSPIELLAKLNDAKRKAKAAGIKEGRSQITPKLRIPDGYKSPKEYDAGIEAAVGIAETEAYKRGIAEGLVRANREKEVIVNLESLASETQLLLPFTYTDPITEPEVIVEAPVIEDPMFPYADLNDNGTIETQLPVEAAEIETPEERKQDDTPIYVSSLSGRGTAEAEIPNETQLLNATLDDDDDALDELLEISNDPIVFIETSKDKLTAEELDNIVDNLIENHSRKFGKLDQSSRINLTTAAHLIYLAKNKLKFSKQTGEDEDTELYRLLDDLADLEKDKYNELPFLQRLGNRKKTREISKKQVELCLTYIGNLSETSEYKIRKAYINLKKYIDHNYEQGKQDESKSGIKEAEYAIYIEEVAQIAKKYFKFFKGKHKITLKDIESTVQDSKDTEREEESIEDPSETVQWDESTEIIQIKKWPYIAALGVAATLLLVNIPNRWYDGLLGDKTDNQDNSVVITTLDDINNIKIDPTPFVENVSGAVSEFFDVLNSANIRYEEMLDKKQVEEQEIAVSQKVATRVDKKDTPKKLEMEKPIEYIADASGQIITVVEEARKLYQPKTSDKKKITPKIKTTIKPIEVKRPIIPKKQLEPKVVSPDNGLGKTTNDALAEVDKVREEIEKTKPKSTRPIIEGLSYTPYNASRGFDTQVQYTKKYKDALATIVRKEQRGKSFVFKSELYKSLRDSSLDDTTKFKLLHAMEVMRTRGYTIVCQEKDICNITYTGGRKTSIKSLSVNFESELELKVTGNSVDYEQKPKERINALDQLNMIMMADYLSSLSFNITFENNEYVATSSGGMTTGIVRILFNEETQNIEMYGTILQKHRPYKLSANERREKKEEITVERAKGEEKDASVIDKLVSEKNARKKPEPYYTLKFDGDKMKVEGKILRLETSMYSENWRCDIMPGKEMSSLTGENGYYKRCGLKIMIERKDIISHTEWAYKFPDQKNNDCSSRYSKILRGNLRKGAEVITMIKNSYGG